MSWNIDNCIPKPFSDALVGLCKVEVKLDPVLQNHWAVHLLMTKGKNVFIILRTIKKMLTTPFNVYNDVDADYEIVNGGLIIIAIIIITTAIPTVTVALMTTMMIMIMSNWMRLSMISRIIKTKIRVICRRQRQKTQTLGFIIYDTIRNPYH